LVFFLVFNLIGVNYVFADAEQESPVTIEQLRAVRYSDVVLQVKPYACGAAALATLLTYFYQAPVTESELLESIEKDGESPLHMADITKMAHTKVFMLKGYRIHVNMLKELTQPVIVRLLPESSGNLPGKSKKSNRMIMIPTRTLLCCQILKIISHILKIRNKEI
jgi:predicted double-glycine peptidase